MDGITDETERQSAEQVSNLSGITNEQMLTSASTEQTPLSKHTTGQHKGLNLRSRQTLVNVIIFFPIIDLFSLFFILLYLYIIIF